MVGYLYEMFWDQIRKIDTVQKTFAALFAVLQHQKMFTFLKVYLLIQLIILFAYVIIIKILNTFKIHFFRNLMLHLKMNVHNSLKNISGFEQRNSRKNSFSQLKENLRVT